MIDCKRMVREEWFLSAGVWICASECVLREEDAKAAAMRRFSATGCVLMLERPDGGVEVFRAEDEADLGIPMVFAPTPLDKWPAFGPGSDLALVMAIEDACIGSLVQVIDDPPTIAHARTLLPRVPGYSLISRWRGADEGDDEWWSEERWYWAPRGAEGIETLDGGVDFDPPRDDAEAVEAVLAQSPNALWRVEQVAEACFGARSASYSERFRRAESALRRLAASTSAIEFVEWEAAEEDLMGIYWYRLRTSDAIRS